MRNSKHRVGAKTSVEVIGGKNLIRLPSGLLPTGLSCINEDGARIVGGTAAQRNTWRWFVHMPQVNLTKLEKFLFHFCVINRIVDTEDFEFRRSGQRRKMPSILLSNICQTSTLYMAEKLLILASQFRIGLSQLKKIRFCGAFSRYVVTYVC